MNGDALTNERLQVQPRTDPGDRLLPLDFPGLEIGTAEYAEGPTG